jgi:upstream activation factor subunit UAF30
VQPDQALAAVVGADPLPRTELTKRVWAYIREHKLQDAQDRRRIRADDKLRAVLEGQDSVTMFELTKCVSRHVT